MSARINHVLTKFQWISWLNFKLRRKQEKGVEIMLMNRDELAVLPNAYCKSSILQTYVMASGQRKNTKAFACFIPASSRTRLPKQDQLESSACPC